METVSHNWLYCHDWKLAPHFLRDDEQKGRDIVIYYCQYSLQWRGGTKEKNNPLCK